MAFPSVIDWSNTASESHIYYIFPITVSLLDMFSGHDNQKIPCPVRKVQRDRLAVPVLRRIGEAELSRCVTFQSRDDIISSPSIEASAVMNIAVILLLPSHAMSL